MNDLLSPENPLMGVNLLLLLVVVLLSFVFFICFSGFVKFSIILNITKNAVGTQQIPPAIVVNLLASLMACNSAWPSLEAGIQRVKPFFSGGEAAAAEEVMAMGGGTMEEEEMETVSMYTLMSNFFDYFPEVLEEAGKKTRALLAVVKMPLNFGEEHHSLGLLLGSLLYDIYKGFEFGLKLYLVFVSIDFLVAVILSGVGMTMLSPTVISTPVKLAVFYFSDSWTTIMETI
ncbi:MAG: hypothetical protein OXC07_09740 [Kistimonas sp.]|nr:hypothetical protein [Kistimonas sp.]